MTKTELIAIMAAVLRTSRRPNPAAIQEAYEIFDAIDEIEQDAARRRKTCFNCRGTGRVVTGANFESMPCPYCSTPADTSSRGGFPLQPTWAKGPIRGPSGIEHQPTCDAVLLADESKCNCTTGHGFTITPK